MAAVAVIDIDKIPQEHFTRWDIVGHQVNRHVLSSALTGTPEVVAAVITLPPGFVHRMHRHAHADQFMLPLAGSIAFQGVPGDPIDVGEGQLLAIPRNEWHEVSNTATVECQVFHFFTGVGRLEDIGFESYADYRDDAVRR